MTRAIARRPDVVRDDRWPMPLAGEIRDAVRPSSGGRRCATTGTATTGIAATGS